MSVAAAQRLFGHFHPGADLFLLHPARGVPEVFGYARLSARNIARRLLHILLHLVVLVDHAVFLIGHLLGGLLVALALAEIAPEPLFEVLLLGCQLLGFIRDIPDLRAVLLFQPGLQILLGALQALGRALRVGLSLGATFCWPGCRAEAELLMSFSA